MSKQVSDCMDDIDVLISVSIHSSMFPSESTRDIRK